MPNTLEKLSARLDELIEPHGSRTGDSAYGWLVASANLVNQVTLKRGTYADQAREILALFDRVGDPRTNSGRGEIQDRQRRSTTRMQSLLSALRQDWEKGLTTEIEYLISAETFDGFLDHAEQYCGAKKHKESAVLVSAVFEDTVRKLGKKNGLSTSKLDTLIDELVKKDVIGVVKAKRLKAAAGVRNKALHAEWDGFDLEDVRESIRITRELVEILQ